MCNAVAVGFLLSVIVCMSNAVPAEDKDIVAYPYYILSLRADVYMLPILPFEMGDLEPYIDRATVEAHYYGHHESYRRRMNVLLDQWRSVDPTNTLTTKPLAKIIQELDTIEYDYEMRSKLRRNLGGYVNHALFWSTLAANPNGTERFPTGFLLDEIENTFGSYFEFKVKFSSAAIDVFGSGYTWLVRDPTAQANHQLSIMTTTNQDCPLTLNAYPILCLDVWEHAYYLKYQFRRVEYITNWWMLIDWDRVDKLDDFWMKAKNVNFERDEL